MAEHIRIEQEFRASRRFEYAELVQITSRGVHLQILGEDIAGDGRIDCENRDKDEDEAECSLDFELVNDKASFVCHRDLLEQKPCRDKRMPTACIQKILDALPVNVEPSAELPSELL